MKRLHLAVVALVALASAGAAWWWFDEDHGGADITSLARQSGVALGPVSARAIPQDDLPPAGTRSLFDHVLAQNDGLAFPFEKLVGVIQHQAPENARPLAVMIPLGRSLLKASARVPGILPFWSRVLMYSRPPASSAIVVSFDSRPSS